jgi:hypothetical protein
MSQHDYSLADAAGASFRSDLNSALGAILSRNSGPTAPSTTVAYMVWVDTTAGLVKRRNAANSAWIIESTIDESFVLSRSSNTILDESDRDKVLIATGSYTQTITAAATLTDGWSIDIIVDSGVTLVIDPNASETVDGATTKSITGPSQGKLVCNGTLFRTIGFASANAATQAEQEAGSSTTVFVTPARQQYHPSAAKVWGQAGVTGNLIVGYNVTSITDVGAGIATIVVATDFSTDYSALSDCVSASGTLFSKINATPAVGSFSITVSSGNTGAATDPDRYLFCAFGDQ